ncbi:MAG: hypothetical protein WKF92_02255 [Pyrinomonadaceae bacterium]
MEIDHSNIENLHVIDAEVAEETNDSEVMTAVSTRKSIGPKTETPKQNENQKYYLLYFVLPFICLTAALLGGLRLSGLDGSFIFLKPALFCLIFASVMLVLFFRSGLIRLESWFSEDFEMTKNAANAAVLLSLFAATVQLFNSLLPEQGLPFWIVAFCFFWTLWNNLFADFDTKKLLQSLGGLFGLAFVVKYLILANLTAPASESWLRSIIENPAKETFTWLLDLPRFSAGTGYIQFFTVVLYLIGLFLLPQSTGQHRER